MAKKGKKKKKSSGSNKGSIVAGIKARLSGGSTGGLFVVVKEKTKNILRLLGPCLEAQIHWWQDSKGNWKKCVCSKRWLTQEKPSWIKPKGGCLVCKFKESLLRKNKPKTAEKFDPQTVFAWNSIFKNDPHNEDGELDSKIFEHKWQVFEGIGDILEDRDDFQDPKNGIGIIVRKKVKGHGKKKNTSYTVAEGPVWPLTKEERNLELKDLDKFYAFPKAKNIADALGIELEDFEEEDVDDEDDELDSEEEIISKKKKKGKKSKKRRRTEEEEDDFEDDEDLDDDDDEEEDDEEEDEEEDDDEEDEDEEEED